MYDLGNKAKEIFLSVLDQSGDPEAFVNAACGDDVELRQRVQALLAAHHAAGDFLAPSTAGETIDSGGPAAAEMTQSISAAKPKHARQIGPYKLLEEIGSGGMGTVWVAKQSQPIKRTVAIKLIKAGMDSQQVLARFEAERQALAMMDHPNIARVLDGGMTPQGRPYFAMEYVKGVPLTEYCDQARLSLKERLELFLPICNAVQHAHQKGIIHRDLKPSNILVCLYDGKPVPKVIDFGLAKAMHHSLTDQSLYTAHGMMIGTPLYMSPEQAEPNNLDIDTRTDVYALGVILYELLTGSTPLEKAQMKQKPVDEILRLIKEVDPPKPSTRLSGSDSLPSIAAQRSIDPAMLARSVTGDLDWVVMKALEKERSRRYETANGLAEDIRRHLSDEPVSASPPSARYRMRKFVKRNRAGVIAASAIAVALLLGVVGTTSGMFWALAEKRVAVAARLAESKAKQAAIDAATLEKAANAQAQKRLAQIEAANEILGSIFENLNPKKIAKDERPLHAILVDNLGKAVEQLEGESIGDPLVVAKMQNRLGISLLGLGEPDQAIVLLEKAWDTRKARLGAEHFDSLASMNNLALAYQAGGQVDKTLPLHEETLKLMKATLGPEHPDTLTVMNNLAEAYRNARQLDKAIPLFEETLKLTKAKLGAEHSGTLVCVNNLAQAYSDAGLLYEALPLFEEALKLHKANRGPEHPRTLAVMNNLAQIYRDTGELDKALPLFEETLKLHKAKLGPEHLDTLVIMNNLALAYRAARQFDKALPLLEETRKLFEAKLGPEHPSTLVSMNSLALAYSDAGQPDKALSLLEQSLKFCKAKLGPEHTSTLITMSNLALAHRDAGQLDKALPLLEETLKLHKTKLGSEHPVTLSGMRNLAAIFREVGQIEKALPLLKEAFKLHKAKLGPDHPQTLLCMGHLAVAYHDAGQLDKALPLLEETLELNKAQFGTEHPNTFTTMNDLAAIYLEAGRHAEAMALTSEVLSVFRKSLPPESPQLAGQLVQCSTVMLKARAYTDAEPLVRESLAIREKHLPDSWVTFNTHSLLGGVLLGQKKYGEAEPLLLKGYEGMKAREATIPVNGQARLTEALERLVQLYEITGRKEDAKKWQAQLDKRQAAAKEDRGARLKAD